MKLYEIIWTFIYSDVLGQNTYTCFQGFPLIWGRDSWLPTSTAGGFVPADFLALATHIGALIFIALILLVFVRLIVWAFRLVAGAFKW